MDYDFSDLDELTLAYAMSVHKSQGSEYPVVVVPLLKQHFLLLQRNLVYTAITRAQRITIHGARGPVRGVVGHVAPHLTREENPAKPPKIHEIFIDIGAANRRQAEKGVRVGDPITLNDQFEIPRGDLAVARAMEDFLGEEPGPASVKRKVVRRVFEALADGALARPG